MKPNYLFKFNLVCVLTLACLLTACGGSKSSAPEPAKDKTPPTITLNGETTISIFPYQTYQELGATALDNQDGEVTVTITDNIQQGVIGEYTITYRAVDAAGNQATATRTLNIKEQRPFITLWDTRLGTNSGGTVNQLAIYTKSNQYYYNYDIDWGDGSTDTGVIGDISHTYDAPGIYTLKITGEFPSLGNPLYTESWENRKFLSVEQWGDMPWKSMAGTFTRTWNFQINDPLPPNLSNVTDLSGMFYRAALSSEVIEGDVSNLHLDISQWDVSNVTHMADLFAYSNLNVDISQWDVSNVKDMSQMFYASSFNQDISQWDVSKVRDMSGMFYRSRFNQDISQWNVSKVRDMSEMFLDSKFNQDIGSWDVSNVSDMSIMFAGSLFNRDLSEWNVSSVTSFLGTFDDSTFNQDISQWDTSRAINMRRMFSRSPFNQDINLWDVSNVADFSYMFSSSKFNQALDQWDTSSAVYMNQMFSDSPFNRDIGSWDVSSVQDMSEMFSNSWFNQDVTHLFNQDIGGWDVSNVQSMSRMFANSPFNQDISQWDVSSVTNMYGMFRESDFNQDISQWDVSNVWNMSLMFTTGKLSTSNYDALLNGWSQLELQPNVQLHVHSKYSSAGETGRRILTDHFKWAVLDAGKIE